MKLIYRGVSYDYSPQLTVPVKAPRSGRSLTYRGQTYQLQSLPVAQPVSPESYTLIYRGTVYRVQRSAEGKTTVTPIERCPSQSKIPDTLPRHCILRLTAKTHQRNLLASLRRRQKAARERGDHELIARLESEHRQLLGLDPEL